MLMYFSIGRRDYHRGMIRGVVRPYWEFQTVLRGRSAPWLGRDGIDVWHRRCLWVFPPGVPHGWVSPAGEGCRVMVAHFEAQDVHAALTEACRGGGHLRIALSAGQATRLERLGAEISGHHPVATRLTPFLVDRLRAELCLMAARGVGRGDLAQPPDDQELRARQALAWFGENLERRVGVAEVARAVGVSAGHLRKGFKAAGWSPPHQLLTEIRLQRAQDLLLNSDLTIIEIAEAVGMSGATVLCRQFRQHTGLPPRQWAARAVEGRGAEGGSGG